MRKKLMIVAMLALMLAGCNKANEQAVIPTNTPTSAPTSAVEPKEESGGVVTQENTPAPELTEAVEPTVAPETAPTSAPTTGIPEVTVPLVPTEEPELTNAPTATPEATATSAPTVMPEPEPTNAPTAIPEPTATGTPTPVPTSAPVPTKAVTEEPKYKENNGLVLIQNKNAYGAEYFDGTGINKTGIQKVNKTVYMQTELQVYDARKYNIGYVKPGAQVLILFRTEEWIQARVATRQVFVRTEEFERDGVYTTEEPTPTPKPTATPRPTATPKPTATPRPTATPKPTPIPGIKSFYESPKDDLSYYEFSDAEVEKAMRALVDRTEKLKSNYSETEALAILKELEVQMKKLTEEEILRNAELWPSDMEEDTVTTWICRNILHLVSMKSPENVELFKDVYDVVFRIALIELPEREPGCLAQSMGMLTSITTLAGRYPEDFSLYFDYASYLVQEAELYWWSGFNMVVSEGFAEYEAQKKAEEEEYQYYKENGYLDENGYYRPVDSKYRLETLYVENELDDVGTNTTSPFAMVLKSEILQCTYESKEVSDGLSALIDRTQQLKVSYSLEEAMDILRDLSELVPEITKQDHARNYELRTHKYNNKFGPTYRRKWDPVYWVEQVVIGQIHKHSIDQEAEIREIYELLFQMGIQEKRNEMNGVSGSMDTIHLMDNIFRKKYSEELADFSEFAWIMSWKYSDTVSEGEVTLEELYQKSLQE